MTKSNRKVKLTDIKPALPHRQLRELTWFGLFEKSVNINADFGSLLSSDTIRQG